MTWKDFRSPAVLQTCQTRDYLYPGLRVFEGKAGIPLNLEVDTVTAALYVVDERRSVRDELRWRVLFTRGELAANPEVYREYRSRLETIFPEARLA